MGATNALNAAHQHTAGAGPRILELASLAIELARSSSKLAFNPARPDDPVRRRPDISLAKSRLGWVPKVPLRQGLATTIEHFRKELGLVST